VLANDPPAKGPGASCSSDAECAPRACVDTSVGKICEQSCDPAAMPSTCPDGTQCTDVEGSNICATPPSKSGGGCDVAGHSPVGGAALLFACAMLLLLRRRA